MKETECIFCGARIVATDDDPVPKCESCQGIWAEVKVVQAIVAGEMDHLIPGLDGGKDDGSA